MRDTTVQHDGTRNQRGYNAKSTSPYLSNPKDPFAIAPSQLVHLIISTLLRVSTFVSSASPFSYSSLSDHPTGRPCAFLQWFDRGFRSIRCWDDRFCGFTPTWLTGFALCDGWVDMNSKVDGGDEESADGADSVSRDLRR